MIQVSIKSDKRTFIDAKDWKRHVEDAYIEEGGVGSLAHEVEIFLLMKGYLDFDNVTWDAEIERIYYEVKGDA